MHEGLDCGGICWRVALCRDLNGFMILDVYDKGCELRRDADGPQKVLFNQRFTKCR